MSQTEENDWTRKAKCRGLPNNWFFPEPNDGEATAAKDVCRRCLVRLECLDFALRTSQKHGIWGGLSERERRRVKQLRKSSGQ